MESLQIAFRDVDRTPLLYVLREMALRHEDLDLQIDHISDGHAYEHEFLNGNIEVICEHLRFLLPARNEGYPVRCLASCQNFGTEMLLVADDIKVLSDLNGKKVAVRATQSSNISARKWLDFLGISSNVEVVAIEDEEVGRWRQWTKVASGEATGVICSQLYKDEALEAGLQILDVPPLPEIGSLFFAGLGPFITANDHKFRSLVRSLYRALHVFHEQPDLAIDIISNEPARLMHLETRDAVRRCYEVLVRGYDRRPIPTIDALKTTFELINEGYEPLGDLNFLTLWDLRYVIELEESKFLESLSNE